MSRDDFLSRWSRRKIEARRGAKDAPPPAPLPPSPQPVPAPAAGATPAGAGEPRAADPPLPPVESLGFDSDFTAFMRPGVDAALRRAALKKLLHDPRFNVMDGLDVYIDDYTQADPIPEGWLEKMNQYASLGNHEPAATPPPDEGAGPEGDRPVEVAGADSEPPPEPQEEAPHSDTRDAASPRAGEGESRA